MSEYLHMLCPRCSIAERGPGFEIENINPHLPTIQWRCPKCDREIVSLRPTTKADPDIDAFARQASAADQAVTEALALVGVQHPTGSVTEAFVSATLSGVIMALVRYHARAGRHLGYRVTARSIIRAITPCLHQSAEAVAPKAGQTQRLS